MKITTPTSKCQLVDIESNEIVGTCTLHNENNYLKIVAQPIIEGYENKKLVFVFLTRRPYLVYKDMNVVEVSGIKQLICQRYDELRSLFADNDGIRKIKVYFDLDKSVIMKKETPLKQLYDDYLQIERKITKLRKENFDVSKYMELVSKREEMKQTLHENHLL